MVCHRLTVAGCIRCFTCCHLSQTLDSNTPRGLKAQVNLGLGRCSSRSDACTQPTDSLPPRLAPPKSPEALSSTSRLRKSLLYKVDGVFRGECVQRRLVCSVGVSPTGARVRSPVSWIALVEETKLMKPIDKAILGMVSESPGRNASEPRGGLEKNVNRRPSPLLPGEGSMVCCNLAAAAGHSGGVVGAAR